MSSLGRWEKWAVVKSNTVVEEALDTPKPINCSITLVADERKKRPNILLPKFLDTVRRIRNPIRKVGFFPFSFSPRQRE